MGISVTGLKFILYCRDYLGIGFSSTATLGRQSISGKKGFLKLISRNISKDAETIRKLYSDGNYCEKLFYELGAGSVDSFDNSAYEVPHLSMI